MKKLMIIAVSLIVVYSASAQGGHGGYHGSVYVAQPRIIVGGGFYSGFYNPYGFYGLFGPYYPYGVSHSQPTKLQRKEEDIKSDYADRIYSVRHDKSLTGKQKRETVRSLKKQRNQEIDDMIANYHKQPSSNSLQ
jgi:hypothetical protein